MASPVAARRRQRRPSNGNNAFEMPTNDTCRTVLGKYRMSLMTDDILGEGSSSFCRKGMSIEGQTYVAIKTYKKTSLGERKKDAESSLLRRFRRQVEVLKKLEEPFDVDRAKRYRAEALLQVEPTDLFVNLIDYSKNTGGEPGADPVDGTFYVVTELAEYSLRDFLSSRHERSRHLSRESVKRISRSILVVVAALHAKGLAHLDLKPDNFMMFSGHLKLIDVDSCVNLGSQISVTDSTISFSPCYCAPEWARFLSNASERTITVTAALDAWSAGITICELVTLTEVFKPMYGNFLRNAQTHREASFLFLDWIGSIKKVPLSSKLEHFDTDLLDLLSCCLLHLDRRERKVCLEALQHSYFFSNADSAPDKDKTEETDESVVRSRRHRLVDTSFPPPLYKGVLFKLNWDGDPNVTNHWLRRDMWIAQSGSLCYYSVKEQKRLILIDGYKLAGAQITRLKSEVMGHAFEVKYVNYEDDEKHESVVFACENENAYKHWMSLLQGALRMDIPTMRLGESVVDLQKFVMAVKNRRAKVEEDARGQFAPVFSAKLWKVKTGRCRNNEINWVQREMWIARNGSLVYYSRKEARELVYYTSGDLLRATYSKLSSEDCCKAFAFMVHLPPCADVEFEPGIFAADTADLRDRWISELQKYSAGCVPSSRSSVNLRWLADGLSTLPILFWTLLCTCLAMLLHNSGWLSWESEKT